MSAPAFGDRSGCQHCWHLDGHWHLKRDDGLAEAQMLCCKCSRVGFCLVPYATLQPLAHQLPAANEYRRTA